MKNVLESFSDYIQVEMLEGENKYMAEGHGLQDAKKGVVFTKFPSVLHLQLKRFEYDFMRDQMVKINDRYEFPLELNLQEFLAEPDPSNVKQFYHLHAVLVHSGSVDGGHYCAFIRPTRDNKWFKFDDDKVIPVTLKEVMEDNFGGDSTPVNKMARLSRPMMQKRFTNAYMLVYIREADYDKVLCPIVNEDVPVEIREQLERERRELQQREKEIREREFMLTVRIVDDRILRTHSDFDLWTFSSDSNEWSFRFNKHKTTWREVQEKYAAHVGKKSNEIRFWGLAQRENKSIRPDIDNLLTESDLDITLATISQRLTVGPNPSYDLKFYCEIPRSPYDHDKLFPPHPAKGYKVLTSMIFVKCFDIAAQRLWTAGHLHVDRSKTISDSLPSIAELIGAPPSAKLHLYEEVHREMITQCKLRSAWKDEEISDGDIITVQIDDDTKTHKDLRKGAAVTVPEHYEYLLHRVPVVFKPKVRDTSHEQKTFTLMLSRKMSYDVVSALVAEQLGMDDPFKLQFTALFANDVTKGVIRRTPATILQDMLTGFIAPLRNQLNQGEAPPPSILYDILDVSLIEMEAKRALNVPCLLPNREEVVDILVSKTASVANIKEAIVDKLSIKVSPSFKLFEISNYMIRRELSPEECIADIPEYSRFVAQQLPDITESNELVAYANCWHASQSPNSRHGTPFMFPIIPEEKFSLTRKRLQGYLGWSDKEMTKVTFKILPMGAYTDSLSPELTDDAVLYETFTPSAPIDPNKPLGSSLSLVLDHPIRRQSKFTSSFERAVRIFN
jgi:ubiquitin carboxyl-terminal hydrolase 7